MLLKHFQYFFSYIVAEEKDKSKHCPSKLRVKLSINIYCRMSRLSTFCVLLTVPRAWPTELPPWPHLIVRGLSCHNTISRSTSRLSVFIVRQTPCPPPGYATDRSIGWAPRLCWLDCAPIHISLQVLITVLIDVLINLINSSLYKRTRADRTHHHNI